MNTTFDPTAFITEFPAVFHKHEDLILKVFDFIELSSHYVIKQIITYKHWLKFEINYEKYRGKGKIKTVACANLK